ncbi:MAG TPA: STAS domain-containing protein [Stellaceae bacterium]|nr:STAS domain-containing protein [Stellaceae bacterium]
MEIKERRQSDVVVLSPIGRVDNETSPIFQAKLLGTVGPAYAAVVIDFTEVEYISSAGLRAILMASKQSKATHGQLAVAALRPIVREIFDISRFSNIVPIFVTTAEAVAALG